MTAKVIPFPSARARKPEPPELTDEQFARLMNDVAKALREEK